GRPPFGPRAGRGRELGGEIDGPNVDEAGRREQPRLIAARADSARTRLLRTPSLYGRQVRRNEDRRIRDSTARSQQASERSQHGELATQSTQNVGVYDRVKRPLPEWLVGAARGDERDSIVEVL